MPIKYKEAPDLQEKAIEICNLLFPHVKVEHISSIRSFGSKSRGTIARCHALGKVMQMGLGRKAFYTVEYISERFDKMSEQDQLKTIIHELMHIPKSFGGGFKHHDFVCEDNINLMYNRYVRFKQLE